MAGLTDISRKYYSNLSPTGARIYKEITLFSGLLGERWNTLSQHEKDCLIDDQIVPPDVRDRYGDHWDAEQEEQYYPRLILKGGGGVVVDTDGETWADEHSSPFSWETSDPMRLQMLQSQNELSLDELLTDKPRQHLKDPKRCKSPAGRAAGGIGGGGGAGAAVARVRTSGTPFDGSPVGGGSDFDQLRSMWEQGIVTGAAAATGGTADDSGRMGATVMAVASTSDSIDGHPIESGSKASVPVTVEGAREVPEAAGNPGADSEASGALPTEPGRGGAAMLPQQSKQQPHGMLSGKPVAAAAANTAAGVGGRTATMAAADVNDDPVFVHHGVTFGPAARPTAAAGRGSRARPQSGSYRTVALETAGSSASGAGEAVKTGFDFLDDW